MNFLNIQLYYSMFPLFFCIGHVLSFLSFSACWLLCVSSNFFKELEECYRRNLSECCMYHTRTHTHTTQHTDNSKEDASSSNTNATAPIEIYPIAVSYFGCYIDRESLASPCRTSSCTWSNIQTTIPASSTTQRFSLFLFFVSLFPCAVFLTRPPSL